MRRIRWREHTTVEVWIFVVLLLFMLFVGISWLIRHPPADHHQHLANEEQTSGGEPQ